MTLPGKLIKILKQAVKSRKYLIVVHWIDQENKLHAGFKALNFPLAVVDRAFENAKELFWSTQPDTAPPATKDGRIPLYQTGKVEVIKK